MLVKKKKQYKENMEKLEKKLEEAKMKDNLNNLD